MAQGREKLNEMREQAAAVQAVADQRDQAIQHRDILLAVARIARVRLSGFQPGGFHATLHDKLNEAILLVEGALDGHRATPGTEPQSTAAANDS